MAGTKSGGRLAAEVNRQRYGPDYYARIGKLGGSKGRTGGFASDKVGPDGLTGRQRASSAGVKGGTIGGKISKRGQYQIKVRVIPKEEFNG